MEWPGASTCASSLPTSRRASNMDEYVTELKNLHPAYFAAVMATGIVSIAANLVGFNLIAVALFYLNVALFLSLWLLVGARLIWFRKEVLADLTDHNRGVGFFTTVAGTCVLGSQFVLISHDYLIGRILWALGIALWVTLTYAIFTGLTIKEEKPPLAEGINGGWLVSVVATQAVAVLGGALAPAFADHLEVLNFFTLCMWLAGGMLYIWLIALIFYRYTFFKFLPSDCAPPYWINMGAVSISTLAGTTLIANAHGSALLQQVLPFLKGFTLLFWATGTWWIPMLFILGIWRHVYKRYPLAYDPLYWGLVFPLGMYTTCTYQLAMVMNLPLLLGIPYCFVYVALVAWAVVFSGLVGNLLSRFTWAQRFLPLSKAP